MSIRICGGLYGSIRIECPASRVRPTTDRVKEAIFSTLGNDLEDITVLDLFAGSGSLGIEAISRGARHVTFVEKSAECVKVIWRNISIIGAQEQAVVIKSEAMSYVKNCTTSFNLIFMDPPYHKDLACTMAPHVYNLLTIGGILVVEHSVREEIPMLTWKTKRYGDTSVSYFMRSSNEEG